MLEKRLGQILYFLCYLRVMNINLDPKETTEDCAVKEESSIPDMQQLVANNIDINDNKNDS